MKKVGPDKLVHSYSARNPVALRVSSGEVFRMETHDRFTGVEHLSNILSADASRLNAVTGAVFVEGAEPGHVLQVDILDIALTLEHGFTFVVPGKGGFGERLEEALLRRLPIRGSFALYTEDIRVPLAPHVGRIGVAPEGEDVPCSTPGPHGGNLDNNQFQRGSSAFFPVFHPGALLALGDIHAAQGDGESALSGIETAGIVTLRCTVRKDLSLTYPLAATRDEV
ncbi:MAG: acetamidase/formamidase family protein, partial [Nitrospinota bacterium]